MKLIRIYRIVNNTLIKYEALAKEHADGKLIEQQRIIKERRELRKVTN